MTELEFEKACRGSGSLLFQESMPGEQLQIVSLTGFDGIDGSGTEKAIPPEANTSFQRIIQGPVRIGIFEGKPTRELSGASYYGVMDLSGNVVEMAVTVGNNAGRNFTGNHGDGELTDQGSANVPSWPRGVPQSPQWAQVPNAGFGYRGGDFWNPDWISASQRGTWPPLPVREDFLASGSGPYEHLPPENPEGKRGR